MEKKKQIDKEIEKLFDLLLEKIETKFKDICTNCPEYTKDCNLKNWEKSELILKEIGEKDEELIQNIYSFVEKKTLIDIQNVGLIFMGKGSSMYPTMKEGDIVIANGNIEEAYNIGDIVMHLVGKRNNVHRIVGFADIGHVYTKGDNCSTIDKVGISTIVGRVYKIIKKEDDEKLWNLFYEMIRYNPNQEKINGSKKSK